MNQEKGTEQPTVEVVETKEFQTEAWVVLRVCGFSILFYAELHDCRDPDAYLTANWQIFDTDDGGKVLAVG